MLSRLHAVWPLALIACGGEADTLPLLDGSTSDGAVDAHPADGSPDTSPDAPRDAIDDVPLPDGGFVCGDRVCTATEYCEHAMGGPAPGINRYSCVALPDSCGTPPTCDCLTLSHECFCTPESTPLYVDCNYP